MTDTARKTQIVIVGGGAGGLELARRLGAKFGRARHDIILVDKKPHPYLEAATARGVRSTPISTRSAIAATAIAGAIAIFNGALEGIDRAAGEVVIAPLVDEDGREIIGQHRIRYDYLVLAMGSVTNDFSTPGGCAIIASSSTTAPPPTASATSCSTIASGSRGR